MSVEAEKSTSLAVPRWLTRAEKAAFRRIEGIRAAAGKPLSEAEIDLVADYVSARGRLTDLRRLYRSAMRDLRESPDDPSCCAAVLSAARAIDTASGAARRLGRTIGIG
jgi:hypothetical protein